MTVPTKAAVKQLFDERMIAGSASNWLPPAMFFLQLSLSGVIILLSLMFYANALGESFVRGLVVVFFCSRVCDVWVRLVVKCVWCCVFVCVCVCVCEGAGEGSPFGGCACVQYCFYKHSENICIPLNPACVALIISCMHQGFSLMEITRLKSYHMLPGEEGAGALTGACASFSSRKCLSGEEKMKESMRGRGRGRGEDWYVCAVPWLQIGFDFPQCIDIKVNASACSHYDI